ncbi:MAG: nitroreductase family deazaflavin-dependent oxidoreductase [Chloroflexi bacterium]|nr:MAG: nitroreductase family deazaflavin-dependent oxidoreductase [Chloroflexota bacterium]
MAARAPFFVGIFNPVAQRLLGAGVPLGPNALLTVRGRKTGRPRSTPVALVEVGGRRWVAGTFGDVNWVRNLRVARAGRIAAHGHEDAVQAAELTPEEAAGFFKDVLGPYIRRVPLGSWMIGSVLGAPEILDDPDAAARRIPVFELTPAAG